MRIVRLFYRAFYRSRSWDIRVSCILGLSANDLYRTPHSNVDEKTSRYVIFQGTPWDICYIFLLGVELHVIFRFVLPGAALRCDCHRVSRRQLP